MTFDKHDELSNALQGINRRITKLEQERDRLLAERKTLIEQISTRQEGNQQSPLKLSATQKVELFQKRFKGRQDVFARRWKNSKGRSGYSFACNNEWLKGVCNKPIIKCNECPNREHTPLHDQVIYDHLVGKHIVGLYPLFIDSTCHLMVADFDKDDWKEAIQAMARTCQQQNIPHAVEISRSGNGAHLWIFFSEPVQAKDARLLGFALLDKAMEIHPKLSFESYDRLLPNQDLMPEGGFGNLIALPLQYQARQQGNSQFVDHNLLPYADQWQFLRQIKSLSPKHLSNLIAKLAPRSQNIPTHQITDTHPPWEQGAKIKPT